MKESWKRRKSTYLIVFLDNTTYSIKIILVIENVSLINPWRHYKRLPKKKRILLIKYLEYII